MNAVDPQLESAWFQPVRLKNEKLVSNFGFKLNLYRYIGVIDELAEESRGGALHVESS